MLKANKILAAASLFFVLFYSCKKETTTTAPPVFLGDNDNLLMGNPGNAMADTTDYDNYLMIKTYYTLSYSRTRGIPNWVSWHTQNTDLGNVSRQEDFREDNSLPQSWYHVTDISYSYSGFERGHNCPSADRTATIEANSSTFFMTNIIPQAPYNNEFTWMNMENYARTLIDAGDELYTIMGSYGMGGTGSDGTKTTIDNGHVTVPSNIWKVIVVLPLNTNDLSRVNNNTRVISVIIPNINTGLSSDWKTYRTSVDAIEAAAGLDLLSNISTAIQQVIEARVDNQ